jgi:hypothetical protein
VAVVAVVAAVAVVAVVAAAEEVSLSFAHTVADGVDNTSVAHPTGPRAWCGSEAAGAKFAQFLCLSYSTCEGEQVEGTVCALLFAWWKP